MNDTNKLKFSIAAFITICVLLIYMWNNSFFMNSGLMSTNEKMELPSTELTNQVYEQIDFIKNLDDSPAYLFKHNLAKVMFLFNHDLPTSEDLISFKNDMDQKSVEELVIKGRQRGIFSDFDVILLTKMFYTIQDNKDYFLQELRVNNSMLEKNMMSSHIAQSYLNLVEKEHQNNTKKVALSTCSRCISVCMNTYTFSTDWWKKYKSEISKRSKMSAKGNINHHAFFYAESSGLTSCEKEVCKSSCDDKCVDCVPSFVYQEV